MLNEKQKNILIEKGHNNFESTEKVLEVKNLRISFKTDNGKVQAVRGVSFDLHKGETLCIVGESGSGKSVTSKAIMGILSNNAIVEDGEIIYQGEDLLKVSEDEFHRIRGHKIGMIFQDPLSSLNPIVKIGKQITETMMINKNQLRNKYNDLISKELTAYKNAKVLMNSAISRAQTHFDDVVGNCKENEKEYTDEIISLNSEIKYSQKLLNNGEEGISKEESFIDHAKQVVDQAKLEGGLLKKVELMNGIVGPAHKKETKDLIIDITKANIKNDSLDSYVPFVDFLIKEVEKEIADKIKDINKIKSRYYTATSDIPSFQKKVKEANDALNLLKQKNESIISEAKSVFNSAKHEAVLKYKKSIPDLRRALKARKTVAKKEVKEYKINLLLAKENKVAELMREKESRALDSATAKKVAKIEREIKRVHRIYGIKLYIFYFFAKRKQKIIAEWEAKLKVLNDQKATYTYEIDDIDKKIAKVNRDYSNSIKISKAEAKRQALEVMKEVGIPQPEKRYYQYPFQFSGGMRQRIVIAIALTAAPDILICDEPTTALDVTIQAQILELINNLKKERNLSCIFITHDLGVVANMADRVAVMYAGKICEYGTDKEIFFDPRHPYTWALLSSIPDIDSKEKLEAIPGTPPDMIYPPVGDAFAARNKYAMAIDFKYQPPYFRISDTHYAATWLLYKDAPRINPPKIVTSRINKALEEEAKNEKQ